MIFKKMNAVVFLLFVSLVCLSAVSAENIDDITDFQSAGDENLTVKLTNSNENIMASENNNIKSSDGLSNEIINTDSSSELNMFAEASEFEGIIFGESNISVDGKSEFNVGDLTLTNSIFSNDYNRSNDGINEVNYTIYDKFDGGNVLSVSKVDPTMDVSVDNITFGEDVIVNVVLPKDATTYVIISIGGIYYTVNIKDGKAVQNIKDVDAGIHDVVVHYIGDSKYNAKDITKTISVVKADANPQIFINDIDYGNIFIINAVLTGVNGTYLSGNIVVNIDGKNYTVGVVNGIGTLDGDKLDAGSYDFAAVWEGNDNYNPCTSSGSFFVNKIDSSIDVVIEDIVVGEDAVVNVALPINATGDVIINVDGNEYSVTLEDGKATQTISNLKAGNYGATVKYCGDNNYNEVTINVDFKVSKITPVIDVNTEDITFGQNLVIVINLPSDATGKVKVSVDGKNYTLTIVDGKVTKSISDLTAGTHNIIVKYMGNDKYNPTEVNKTANVAKADATLEVSIIDVDYDKIFTIGVTLIGVNKDPLNGEVIVDIGDKLYTVKVADGNGTLKGDKLVAGSYDFNATWAGNVNYNIAQDSGSFNVNKLNATMDVIVPKDVKVDECIIIVVNVPKDATGKVNVEIEGKFYSAIIKNGVASINISSLPIGIHNFTVIYSGDEKYNSVTKTGTVNVINNGYVNLNVTDIAMIYHDGTRLIAILTDYMGNPIANATIYFTVNGVVYNRTTDATGSASMALNLNSGEYRASILFNGSDMYDKAFKNVTVTIKSTIDGQNIVKFYQNGTQFFVTFIDINGNILANQNVTFNINGVFYTRKTNENGTARLAINLRPGEYILTAINPNSTEQKGFHVTVKSLIEADDLTKYFQNASRFEAKIYNKDGSLATNTNVTFNINGVFYTRSTNNEGIVSLAINLRPGTYNITTMYDGLDVGNTVKVLPTLETNDLSMKYKDRSKFKAKTVDGQGNPLANQNVTFNVNGVFYHKVTGNDGVASLNINLNPGEYIITSIWNNYQVGNKITIA